MKKAFLIFSFFFSFSVILFSSSKVEEIDPTLLNEALGTKVVKKLKNLPLVHLELFKEQSSDNKPIAYLFNSGDIKVSERGYRDKVDCYVLIAPDGKIISVIVGENKESPKYLKRVLESKFLKDWVGKKINDKTPETVSGATRTSSAINNSVQAVLKKLEEINFFKK